MKKINKVFYSLPDFQRDVLILAEQIRQRGLYKNIFGIPKGGVPLAMALAVELKMPLTTTLSDSTLVVDDLIDTGKTISKYQKYDIAVLHEKAWAKKHPKYVVHRGNQDWIVYWWEGSEEKSIEDSVIRQLQFIGEDPTREGLKETPRRICRSWNTLYSGYRQNPDTIFKTFEDGACDEMVLLKNVEFYSNCEHHMLPFFGRAHIAYIPNGKVIGVSKLARLLDIFARRLQIQERIGQQITEVLMKNLQPLGAACILEAQHFCMTSRGVQKQDSVMVTSSLTGVFRDKPETRAELIELIK